MFWPMNFLDVSILSRLLDQDCSTFQRSLSERLNISDPSIITNIYIGITRMFMTFRIVFISITPPDLEFPDISMF